MTDFAWLNDIEKRLKDAQPQIIDERRLKTFTLRSTKEFLEYVAQSPDDIAKLIETVKVMREAFEDIERETDCPATQTTILNALEKCK